MKECAELRDLVIASIRLAIIRHDLATDECPTLSADDADVIGRDTWDALNGVGTCSGEVAAELAELMNIPKPTKPFIVAEVSCSWPRGEDVVMGAQPAGYEMPLFLAQRFEDVLNVNHSRGYDLAEWRFCTSVRANPDPKGKTKDIMTETIVAVFRLREEKR